jgi:hypothetical protein
MLSYSCGMFINSKKGAIEALKSDKTWFVDEYCTKNSYGTTGSRGVSV